MLLNSVVRPPHGFMNSIIFHISKTLVFIYYTSYRYFFSDYYIINYIN